MWGDTSHGRHRSQRFWVSDESDVAERTGLNALALSIRRGRPSINGETLRPVSGARQSPLTALFRPLYKTLCVDLFVTEAGQQYREVPALPYCVKGSLLSSVMLAGGRGQWDWGGGPLAEFHDRDQPCGALVVVEKSIQDLMTLMQDLSAYSNQFLEMVCDKLKEYKEICNTAYSLYPSTSHLTRCYSLLGIVQCEEKLTISASWSKDEDISRLLQSLPNWANMAQPRQLRQKREDEEDFTRAAFAKESEVLTGNLGDKLIPQNEILRDVSDLKALANLQESMEWLASRLKGFFINLPHAASEYTHIGRHAYIHTHLMASTHAGLAGCAWGGVQG
ncbi:unnamed protein product [Coregonus sp. 'balchen']|nr:unnamed protein product [Coregonus sp. 'balchen']